jgi:CMP-N-acetylneuraminic acid synthetase
MDWTLEAAIGADGIDDVIVTTPDQDLLDHLRATYANEVIALHRDPSLALANTYIEDTLLDALDRYEGDHSPPAALMLLSIEAPFRTSRHIDSAIDVMAIFETDLVVGVRPETGVFYQHNGASLVPIRKTSGLRLERDELYREVGQMQLISTKFLRRTRSLDSDRVGHVVLDQWAALSLMTQFDWQIAEARLNSITDAAEAGAKAP